MHSALEAHENRRLPCGDRLGHMPQARRAEGQYRASGRVGKSTSLACLSGSAGARGRLDGGLLEHLRQRFVLTAGLTPANPVYQGKTSNETPSFGRDGGVERDRPRGAPRVRRQPARRAVWKIQGLGPAVSTGPALSTSRWRVVAEISEGAWRVRDDQAPAPLEGAIRGAKAGPTC